MNSERSDSARHQRVLEQLLREFPDATVGATDSIGRYVDCPASLDLGGRSRPEGRLPMDLVAAGFRTQIIDAWTSMQQVGLAWVSVELRDGSSAVWHFVDLSDPHEVCVAMLVLTSEVAERVRELEPAWAPVAPRFGVARRSDLGYYLDVDEGTAQLVGIPQEELAGRSGLELIHPDDQERAVENWLAVLSAPDSGHRWRGRHQRGDGSYVWLEFTNYNQLADPDYHGVRCEAFDISSEMAAVDALTERERMFRRLAEAMSLGVLDVGVDGRVFTANQRALELLGSRGGSLDEHFAGLDDSDRALLVSAIDTVRREGSERTVLVTSRTPAGPRICECTIGSFARTEGGFDAVVCLLDVTERVEMQQQLERQATFDALTGCHNRQSTDGHLAQHCESGPAAVVYVDLDGFKAVNDHHGHAAGDAVLTIVGERVRRIVREGDVVGRVGGDEFVVLCPATNGASVAIELAERIRQAINQPFDVQGVRHVVQTSIGIAWSSAAGIDPDVLVAAADAAMYESKRNGRGEPVLAAVLTPDATS